MMQTALNMAVDSCIEKGILKEFLLKNRAEFGLEKVLKVCGFEGVCFGLKNIDGKIKWTYNKMYQK